MRRLLADVRDALASRSHRAPRPTRPLPGAGALTWRDFGTALAEAHGELQPAVTRAALPRVAKEIAGPRFACAHGAAAVLGLPPAPAAPDRLDGLPWLVATGSCAVARAGAVAVGEEDVPVRLHLVLPECLLLLVPVDALVDDLADLYDRSAPSLLAGGYLCLVAGPSKTADIEQQLVTGAHGPRRLVVLPYS